MTIATTYHRIHKSDEEDRIQKVCLHLGSLGNCSCNNGRQCTGKGELEEPLMIGSVVHEEKVGVADKGFLVDIGIVTTIGKGVSTCPECEATTTGIEKVPQDDVLYVLGTDGSSTKHGKTGYRSNERQYVSFEFKNFHDSFSAMKLTLHEIHKGTLWYSIGILCSRDESVL